MHVHALLMQGRPHPTAAFHKDTPAIDTKDIPLPLAEAISPAEIRRAGVSCRSEVLREERKVMRFRVFATNNE